MRTLDELGISKTPWKTEDGLIMGIRILTGVTDGNGELVAIERNKSDARLIASAPMLYKCLREAVIESCHECPAYKNGKCESSVEKVCFVRKWHDALAAASGEGDEGVAK